MVSCEWLPRGEQLFRIELRYLEAHNERTLVESPLEYLQRVRQEEWRAAHPRPARTNEAIAYQRFLPRILARFRQLLENTRWDAVVRPRSSRPRLTLEYYRAVVPLAPDSIDLSPRLHRTKGTRAGLHGSYPELLSRMRYQGPRDLGTLSGVLIVDDVLASGSTAAVIVTRLREAGLSPDARIVLACPLRLTSVKQAHP
jgi:hypothetical protein